MKNLNNETLVSIIMPTYNRAYIIEKAIQSVLSQSYTNFELIIVDDGSSDDTEKCIESIKDARIRYYKSETNRGASYARNIGIKKSKGEYIAFLDSDNIWNEKFLELRVALFGKIGSEVGMIWGPVEIKEQGKRKKIFPEITKHDYLLKNKKNMLIKEMIFDNLIDTNSVVLRKDCFERNNGFCEELMRLQDWEFFFRLLIETHFQVVFDDNILVTNYIKPDSIGTKKNDDKYWHARGYFINKHKDVISKYCDMGELFKYLLCKKSPQLSREELIVLIGEMSEEDLANVILDCRKKNQIAQRENNRMNKINMVNDMNISYLNSLHNKEYRIIEFQKRWIDSLIMNKNIIIDNLKSQSIKSVSIFGIGWIGESLVNLFISNSDIKILSIIDSKKEDSYYKKVKIIKPEEYDYQSDAVIVTVLDEFEEIRKMFKEKERVISVKDLLG